MSETAWARFVDREITPRFPDGFSVIDARGQWRDPDRNRIMREPSKLVQIVLTTSPRPKPRRLASESPSVVPAVRAATMVSQYQGLTIPLPFWIRIRAKMLQHQVRA